jgi:outer membrane biosynthesis protein TonB
MEKKAKVLVYVPQEVYIEIHKRQLTNHISYLVSRLLEEFLKAGVRITWEEMPTRAKQREYLEAKLQEFFSRNGLSSEPPKPPVQGRVETTEVPKPPVQERTEAGVEPTTPVHSATKSEPVKEEPPPSPKEKDQGLSFEEGFLKKWEAFW